MSLASLEVNELDVEDQGGVGWDNTSNSSSTISIVWWACEGSLLAFLELADAFVPASDHLAFTNNELEGFASWNA